MNYRKFSRLFCPVLVLLLTLACNQPLLDRLSGVTPTPTFTAVPTFAPTLFAYLTASAGAEPFAPFATWTQSNTEVRTGPGLLFSEIAKLPQYTELLILGKAIGDEWLYVQLPSGEEGWTFVQRVQLFGDLPRLPAIEPNNAQLVIGRVVDENNEPVNGVRIDILRFVEDYGINNSVTTDAHGFFYSFMPTTATGEWLVSYSSLACESNKMPLGCSCPQNNCGQLNPLSTTVILPQTTPLLFIWK